MEAYLAQLVGHITVWGSAFQLTRIVTLPAAPVCATPPVSSVQVDNFGYEDTADVEFEASLSQLIGRVSLWGNAPRPLSPTSSTTFTCLPRTKLGGSERIG